MNIYTKSTRTEFTVADIINLCTDAAKLETVVRLLREKEETNSADIIADVADSLLDLVDKVEASFNKDEEEGS